MSAYTIRKNTEKINGLLTKAEELMFQTYDENHNRPRRAYGLIQESKGLLEKYVKEIQ